MRRRPVPDLPPEAFALHGPVSQNAELPRSQPAEAVRDLIDLLMTKDLDDEVLLAEAEATISVNGEVTAEATAVFIEVPPTQMLGIVERNAERADGDVIDPLMRKAISDLSGG